MSKTEFLYTTAGLKDPSLYFFQIERKSYTIYTNHCNSYHINPSRNFHEMDGKGKLQVGCLVLML